MADVPDNNFDDFEQCPFWSFLKRSFGVVPSKFDFKKVGGTSSVFFDNVVLETP
jgi:hypothetical protein